MSDSQNPKILIVEDDERIAKLLRQFLNSEGFDAVVEHSAESAIENFSQHSPDLIVLDLMLPGMDGVAFCQQIRGHYSKSILMLTAHEGDMQEVIALNAGVDDFVAKPIRTHVLLARIKALLRRQTTQTEPNVIKVADLHLDHANRTVCRGQQQLALSDSEFELIWYLAQHAGNIVTRDDLFKALRGREYDGLDRSIDMRVSTLRKTLSQQCDNTQYIVTLRQRGYIFQRQISKDE